MTRVPLYRWRPQSKWTLGHFAARVGTDLGIDPDPEQQWILDTIFGERDHNRPTCHEVGVVAPRQNIKTSSLGVAALADIFVFGIRKHVWSSHSLDTSRKTFTDFQQWIRRDKDYLDQVKFFDARDEMAIEHRDSGARIEFTSRTGGRGRGYTGVERITLDEALYLRAEHMGAILPTMLTQPGAQLRIASSAGLVGSGPLRQLRDRGRTRSETRLAYVEYGAERKACADPDCQHAYVEPTGCPGCALDDRELWWRANPALWSGRVTEDSVLDLRKSLPPEEFAREMLSWWDDPLSAGGAIDVAAWATLADPRSPRGRAPVYGVDVSGDRAACIGVVWARADGGVQAMLTANDEGRSDTRLTPARAVERLADIVGRFPGVAVLGGPALDLRDELVAAGVRVIECSGQEFAQASGRVADGVAAGTLHHGGQTTLTDAVRAAEWRKVGPAGDRAFRLDVHGVGPLAAVTRAMHGLRQPVYRPFVRVSRM